MDLEYIIAAVQKEGLSITPACKGLLQRECVEPLWVLIAKLDRIGRPRPNSDYERYLDLFVNELVSQARGRDRSMVGVKDFDEAQEVLPLERFFGEG